MPFGKHKGKPMRDVPVGYLNYLWNNGLKNDSRSVGSYIRRNLVALKAKSADLTWD